MLWLKNKMNCYVDNGNQIPDQRTHEKAGLGNDLIEIVQFQAEAEAKEKVESFEEAEEFQLGRI